MHRPHRLWRLAHGHVTSLFTHHLRLMSLAAAGAARRDGAGVARGKCRRPRAIKPPNLTTQGAPRLLAYCQ